MPQCRLCGHGANKLGQKFCGGTSEITFMNPVLHSVSNVLTVPHCSHFTGCGTALQPATPAQPSFGQFNGAAQIPVPPPAVPQTAGGTDECVNI